MIERIRQQRRGLQTARPYRPASAVLLTALLAALTAQPASALDLAGAWEAAARHDALVTSARQDVIAASERRNQAEALRRPSLGAALSGNSARVDSNVSNPRSYQYGTGGLNLNVPLYRPVAGATAEQAAIAEQIARNQLRQVEQDLAIRVTVAYFDALAADDAVAVAEAQRTAIAEQFAAAKRNFEVGTATITDQQEAQARLDLNQAQLAAARNDLIVKTAALRSLTGRDPTPLFPLRRDAALPGNPEGDLDSFAVRARENSLAIRQARLGVDVAAKEVERAKYGHYPTLDAVGQASATRGNTPSNNSPLVTRSNTLAGGLQLAVPLYSGGALSARERETVALRGRAESDLENAQRQVEQAARQVYLGLNSNLEQVAALEAAERSSRLALQSNLLGYQVGVRINVDVLNAQQQWFTTRRDLSRARYDVLVNSLRLRAVTGELDVPDITAVNDRLIAPELQPREVEPPTLPADRGPTAGEPRPGTRPAPSRVPTRPTPTQPAR